MIGRAAVLVAALGVLAWLAIMERDARLLAQGRQAAEAGDLARAEADFRGARLLNPDTTPDVSRAFVFRAQDRRREAVAVLEDVLGREPDNRSAWGALLAFAQGYDQDAERRALGALRRLDPLNAARRARPAPR